ncbi:MAG TPA: GatB/YqeY domain-containing protein [Bryobacteraceae bacterium]|nr:GatB/YqeY domain-containing protein [Bryobacteraceae bacterium]
MASRASTRAALWAVLAFALALRTYHLTLPAWDYHNWRQTITLMVPRDLARHGFDVLHPQVAWVSQDRPSQPTYFSGEFPLQGILAAALYRIFGESDTIARLVVIVFSLLGIYFLYDLLDRRAGPRAARLGALVYAVLPYQIFFGRVFMPDVPALSLALGGLAWVDRWTFDRRWRTLLAASALTSLALLQKVTVAGVCLAIAYLFWVAYREKLLRQPEPYVFAAIALVPAMLWSSHSFQLGVQCGTWIMQPFTFGRRLELWLKPSMAGDILSALVFEAFSPAGIAIAALGLFWPARGPIFSMLRLWLLGALVLLFLIPELLPDNHYYLSLLLPAAAGLAGASLARLADRSRTLVWVMVAVFVCDAMYTAVPFYRPDRWPVELGVELNRITRPEDLLIVDSGGSPNVLYFADRRGWMIDSSYPADFVQFRVKLGAAYFASVQPPTPARRDFFAALDASFERLSPDGRAGPGPIYRLKPRTRGNIYNRRMPLLDLIQKDMTAAMKASEQARLDALRMIKAALMKYKVDSMKPLDEPAELQILNTLIKQRREAADMFRKGNRPELADKEETELKLIESYMPSAPTEAEVDDAIAGAMTETGVTSLKQMGVVMKAAQAKLAGKRVDGKALSDRVRSKLS